MNGRKVSISIIVLLVTVVATSALAFGSRSLSATIQQNDVQTVTVEVNSKGFEPSSLKLKAGAPAKLTFIRKTDETCAKEVLIKDYGISRKLPLDEPVTVEFTPRKGEFTFTCGMNMFKSKLIVE